MPIFAAAAALIRPLAAVGSKQATKLLAPLAQKLAFASYQGGIKGALAKFAFWNVDSFAKYPLGNAALMYGTHKLTSKKPQELPPGMQVPPGATGVPGAAPGAAGAVPGAVPDSAIPEGNIYAKDGANIDGATLDAQLNTFGDDPSLTNAAGGTPSAGMSTNQALMAAGIGISGR